MSAATHHPNLLHSIGLRRQLVLVTAVVILLALMAIDLTTGPSGMTLNTLWQSLWSGPNGPDRAAAAILWQIRLPQTLTGALVGICLGMAGLMMQTILANPLASPYTLGFSAAAGLGAALVILFGSSLPLALWISVPVAAFIFTLLACSMVYLMARFRSSSTEMLVLSGIVVLFFFQSLQSLLQYLAAPEVLQQIVFWLFGSLTKASWVSVTIIAIILIFSLPWILRDAWNLTSLCLGDLNAASLGLNVAALRRRIFILIALLTAAAVSFTGTIGFIGLMHIGRALVGEDHRFSLPLAGILGAIILVAASIVGKLISTGAVIPIGIVTAIAGIPMLAIVIYKTGNPK
ncbi:FecCD family ABC transporter permease [Nitrincola sp.]|uniref:FecCD family ABC transporter permease n=1 Tax=Nitrincola sp. TaxID=1926584 RepID=UPI003A938E62